MKKAWHVSELKGTSLLSTISSSLREKITVNKFFPTFFLLISHPSLCIPRIFTNTPTFVSKNTLIQNGLFWQKLILKWKWLNQITVIQISCDLMKTDFFNSKSHFCCIVTRLPLSSKKRPQRVVGAISWFYCLEDLEKIPTYTVCLGKIKKSTL